MKSEFWFLMVDALRARVELALKPETRERAVMPSKSGMPIEGMQIEAGFARIPVRGVMMRQAYWYDDCDTTVLGNVLQEMAGRTDIHTVLLDFDSPGGEASGTQELGELALAVAAEKRLVGWVENVCGSAAYWLASACDEIYARPSAVVGSIGCYHALIDVSQAWAQMGVNFELFTSAPGKLFGSPVKPFTDEARAFFQGRVEELGGEFRAFVEGRRPQATEAATATGVYGSAGTFGMSEGLVDGTFLTLDHLLAEMLEG